jgi:transposase
MKPRVKDRMNEHNALAMDAAAEGARRATGEAASIAPPPDPEVAATAKRRHFSGSERNRILAAADRCTQSGEIGALLRHEGIYSSHLHAWRKQRAAALRAAVEPKKRGRKADPALAEARRIQELTRENARLLHKLAQAHTIIDVQKKLCSLWGLPTHDTPGEPS